MSKPVSRVASILIVLGLFGSVSSMFGQGASGSMSGTVTDQQGAVVANATVEATNLSNGEKHTATTGDNGTYTMPNLAVGLYNVTATGTGFAPTTVKDLKISVAFNTDQDFSLNPQGASETIVVTTGDAATQLNTTDQQLSTIIENKKIIDLPLLSRDPNALILLSPGTVASNSGLGGFAVNGQRERNNNFMVDGIDNNDADVPGIPGGISTPNIDATQEFRVITGNFNAEYGRNTGAIITVANKNGTNDFHGNAYMYYRSDAFNARNFFDQSGKADLQQRRQFGGSIGGPIIKDKAFFFFNYEGDRFNQGFTITRVVPTARARQGNFDFGGALGTINANTNAIYGDVVLPRITQYLNQFYPLPNSGGAGPLPGIFENYVFGSQTNDRSNQFNSRGDYRFNEKHNLSVTFNHSRANAEFCCETFAGTDDSIKSPQKSYLLALNLVSNLTPNLVNEARFGGNRSELFFYGDGEGGTNGAFAEGWRATVTALGGQAPTITFGNPNMAQLGFNSPGSGLSSAAPFDTQFRYTGTTVLADSLTWVKGNHTFKFGGEHRRVYTNGASDFGRIEFLDFNYSTNFGDPVLVDNGGTPLSLTGAFGTVNNFANLLYGFTDFRTQSQYFNKDGARTEFDYRGYRVRELDFFFQDTWRLRPNFTLNYGMRYEYKGVPFEVNGQMSTLVNQDPSGFEPAGGFTFDLVGKNSGGSGKLYNNDFNNFAPRFGFAWSPGWDSGIGEKFFGGSGQSSIRGGYGIFYDRVFGNLFSNSSANPPFQIDVFDITLLPVGALPRPTTQTPSRVVPSGAQIFPVIFALPGNNQFQSKFANPYTQAWNFGMQRQFGNNFLVEADYVGNHGLNQLRVIDGQMTSVERVNAILGLNRTISPTSTFTNYLNGVLSEAFFQTATNLSVGQSTYHAGQFRITKNLTNARFGTGQIQGAYTWSHSIDDSTDPLVGQTGERTFPRDSSGFAQTTGSNLTGWRAEKGSSGFDVRHRFVMNFLYEVPLKFENNLANGIFGDWALTGIWQWQSGSPWTAFGGTDSAGTALGQRADFANPNAPATSAGFTRLTPTTSANPRVQIGPNRDQFRNPCSGVITIVGTAAGSTCTLQLDGRQGNLGRNSLIGPDYNKFDLAMMKRIPLNRFKEGMRFTIRADFFNLFNRVNLDKPNATNININSNTFGQATTAQPGRIVQFVGRFEF